MPGTGVAATVYRPRHPERTDLYRLFERHLDRFVREYEERFEHRHGPLRAVVVRAVGQYLECGRPEGGFARIRCPSWQYGGCFRNPTLNLSLIGGSLRGLFA